MRVLMIFLSIITLGMFPILFGLCNVGAWWPWEWAEEFELEAKTRKHHREEQKIIYAVVDADEAEAAAYLDREFPGMKEGW